MNLCNIIIGCVDNHFNMKRKRSYLTFLEDFPPSQHSPDNILNVLNDDCIKEIFGRLQNRRDFINAANVCKRFQYVAQVWFPHEALQIAYKYRKSSICPRTSAFIVDDSSYSRKTVLGDLCAYLRLFGKCIRNIELFKMRSSDEQFNLKVFKLIEHFCGKTLIGLAIYGKMEICLTSTFKVLERFELYFGALDRFEPPRSLKYLRLTQLNRNSYSGLNLRCLERNFPKLVEAHLGDFTNLMPMTDWLGSFLKCNRQLVKLTLIANQHFVPQAKQMIHSIGKYSTNLESLHLDLFSIDVKDLIGLTKLKCLHIPYGCLRKQDMDALVALNLPIEELHISLKTGDTYVAKCISEFKWIKSLTLDVRFVRGQPIYSVLENLPPLDHLKVRGVDILKMQDIRIYGKHIKKITSE